MANDNPNIQINITENGTTTLATKGTKNVEDIDINVNVGGGISLNIEYSDTAPSDTSKLWVKGNEPEELLVSGNPKLDKETPSILSTTLLKRQYGMGVASVGAKIYLFGGYNETDGSRLNTIQMFDTTSHTLTTLSTTLSVAAYNIGTVSVGTKIYLFGGYSSSFLKTIQVFDTATNTINTLSITLPTACYDIGVASVGDKIYLFGGQGSNGQLSTIQVFNTTNNTLTTLSTALSTSASSMGTASVDTKIYLFGGSGSSFLKTIQVFDTTNNTISTLSVTLPQATYSMGVATIDTKIYLFGGYYYNSSRMTLNTIQVFDTTTNIINTLSTTLQEYIGEPSVASVGKVAYLFGGVSQFEGKKSTHSINTIQVFPMSVNLTNNKLLILNIGYYENVFNLLSSPTQVEISVKNVYRGNSSNIAELEDAYLHNGTNWVNVNTGETNN